MAEYVAPLRDLKFVLEEVAGLDNINRLPGYEEATPDLVDAILAEAGRFSNGVLSPINRNGDLQGSQLVDGKVVTPDGWKEAYRAFIEGGWNGLSFDSEFGGQALPWLISAAVQEMHKGANMAFDLCPLLTQAAVEAITLHGSAQQKSLYLEKLVSGEWTGTMNLTEPQAGSDLAAVKTVAQPNGDHYLLKGQKIFITYGDHDLTENIIHLVLAKVPGAPEGVKGISLFIVPKYILNDEGEPGERNDVHCVSLEHKLGIHGSPTAVLAYGDHEGAVGYLVGEENRGLEYMFTMMNLARHAVGVEGYALAERAYQKALEYARDRIQGRDPKTPTQKIAIFQHPDVRRMLMDMRVHVEAMRGLGCICAAAMDQLAKLEASDEDFAQARTTVDILTPIVKAWSSEVGAQMASLGVQVHGGMGFIEETGAAQYYRDVRITQIYEGTTGIQAADLAGRKLMRDGGLTVRKMLGLIREDIQNLTALGDSEATGLASAMNRAMDDLEASVESLLTRGSADAGDTLAVSVPYLMQFGYVAGGWVMVKSYLASRKAMDAGSTEPFYDSKLVSCRYYISQLLPMASANHARVLAGGNMMTEVSDDWFDSSY